MDQSSHIDRALLMMHSPRDKVVAIEHAERIVTSAWSSRYLSELEL